MAATPLMYVKSCTGMGTNPLITAVSLDVKSGSFIGKGDDAITCYPGRLDARRGTAQFENAVSALSLVGTKVAAPTVVVNAGGTTTASISLTNAVFTSYGVSVPDGVNGEANVPSNQVAFIAEGVAIA